jgi:molybdenum cofactor cytidylyltransferase
MSGQARLDARLFTVLLAAGDSSRLGSPKQLLRRRVRPLLLDACHAAAAVTPGRVIVVLGRDALRMRRLLARSAGGVRCVVNTRWRDGMSGSLHHGLKSLPPACTAALVSLCDQPEVDARALTRLAAAWRRHPRLPAAARYAGRVGVPAVLPRRLWREIGDGDRGARDLLRSDRAIMVVEMPEAAVDVDTRADSAKLRGAPRRIGRVRSRRGPRARAWRS